MGPSAVEVLFGGGFGFRFGGVQRRHGARVGLCGTSDKLCAGEAEYAQQLLEALGRKNGGHGGPDADGSRKLAQVSS
jgi:hypothetical protein